ncbi:ABC transporter [Hyphomonas johnsonii MHS-2]|uniref:Transport permease protein n=1 Tax=Hyphomonas johnsonii MHS-2 TaxID=1280950 RepID=A0A059FV48_9PROT|nr:ABC transporter [Hyphomonas johnsonii MHS-2]
MKIVTDERLPKDISAAPLSESQKTIIDADRGLFSMAWGDLWDFRELVFFMVWRDVSARYKQTVLGIAWAVIQPVLTMIVFIFIFGRIARIPTGGVPYSLMAFAAIVPWTYFSQAVSRSGLGMVKEANLISKVYFPRIILPLATTITPLIDFVLAFLFLTGMLVWYQVAPNLAVVFLPLFIVMAIVAAFGFSLWLAALNVRYRDVQYLIPFFVQIGMFASPVAYMTSLVPEQWRLFYELNPMVAVIEGFRWCLLGTPAPSFEMVGMGLLTIAIVLPSGFFYFKATERTFADII